MSDRQDTGQSREPVRLKTVYDTTRIDVTGHLAAQLRLHVASWAKNVRSSSGLTVTCIEEPPRDILEYLEAAGADIDIVPKRHPLYERSPIYNKHLAAPANGNSERVFLTDNDTIYLGDIAALNAVPDDRVALSLPDLRRVTPELWEELITDLSLPVIHLKWVPWKERGLAAVEGRPPSTERFAYFNGGAVLFPSGESLWRNWEEETYRISSYLQRRGLDDRKDAGSDQLSLTAAVAAYGRWGFLPDGYNIRPFRFWLPDRKLDPVIHLHMVNTGRAVRALYKRDEGSLAALLKCYWDIFLHQNIDPGHEALAGELLGKTLDIVAEFELDKYS